jgi:inhibitor of KinA sporulation pathway (predicted exonuclease)
LTLLLRSCCSLFVGRALQEVIEDEAVDEFSAFFRGEKTPKILFTTSQKPTKV